MRNCRWVFCVYDWDVEQFLTNNLVFLRPFSIIASNGNRRSSENWLLFFILHALLQKIRLCHLQRQIHFWWYLNQNLCINFCLDLRPYNDRRTIFVDPQIFLNVGLSPFKEVAFICLNKSPLELMKNAFYFMLKILLVLEILAFFVLTSWLCRKAAR